MVFTLFCLCIGFPLFVWNPRTREAVERSQRGKTGHENIKQRQKETDVADSAPDEMAGVEDGSTLVPALQFPKAFF